MRYHFCFVCLDLPIHGNLNDDEDYLWPIAQKIALSGHQVTIFSYNSSLGEETLERDNLKIHYLGGASNFVSKADFPQLIKDKIIEISKEGKIDHIHSIDFPLTSIVPLLQKNRVSLSYGVQATDMENLFSKISPSGEDSWSLIKATFLYPILFVFKFIFQERPIVKYAQGMFVSSPKQALTLERFYLFPPNWIFQIPLESTVNPLIKIPKSESVLKELDIGPSRPVIVASTNMREKSELYFLLNLFEKIALKHPKTMFLVLGEGPQFQEFQRQVLIRALDERVRFKKQFPFRKLPSYISIADVFINIGYSTSGLGPTLIEAMSQEKVIIGSAFSPISEIIQDGKNGFLVRPGELQKALSLVEKTLNNELDRESIGSAARKDILHALNRDGLARKTIAAFEKIVHKNTRLFKLMPLIYTKS